MGALAALTGILGTANQAGEAGNEVRQEKEAKAQKLHQMNVEDAYLQLAKQADQRQQQSQEQAIKAGDLLKIKVNGQERWWSVSQGKLIDMPKATDPLTTLKTFISKQKKETADQLESEAETLSSSGMAPEEVIKKVLDDAKSINTQEATRAAADERARLSRESAEKRAAEGRKGASARQQASFGEREKLSHDVVKAQSDSMDADARVTRMANDIQNADKSPDGAGAFDMDLLSQHVALTFGAIKGGMRSKAMIDEHRNAVSLLEKVKRAYQGGVRGAQLSPEQRRNFLILGKEAQAAAHDKYSAIKMSIQGTPAQFSEEGSEPGSQMLPGEEIEQ